MSLRIVPTRLTVDSDPSLLARIVGNLVSNAIRYTRTGGVLVGARRCGGRVAIDVVDTGIGIAPAERQRVFEEFYQVQAVGASSRVMRGMGLGLAIVRRFAALLGHDVVLTSEEGVGSRFRVLTPRTEISAPARHARTRARSAPRATRRSAFRPARS